MFNTTGSVSFPMSYDYGNDYGQTSGSGNKGWSARLKILCASLILLILVVAGLTAAVVILALKLKYASPSHCETADCVKVAGDILEAMNPAVSPCDDFYEYACGGWSQRNPIPVTSSEWGQFEILREKLSSQIREILEEDEPTSGPNMTETPEPLQLARDFYDTCVEQEDLELDNEELVEVLETLVGTRDTFSLTNITNVLASLRRKLDANYLFSIYVELDERNSSNHVIYLDQPVLALAQEHLIDPGKNFWRQAYVKLIEGIWKFVYPEDQPMASTIAEGILRIEIALANISATPEEMNRNKSRFYNPTSFEQFVEMTQPNFFLAWASFFENVFQEALHFDPSNETHLQQTLLDEDHFSYEHPDLSDADLSLDFRNLTYIVKDVAFFQNLGTTLDVANSLEDIRNFLKWRIIFDFGGEANVQMRRIFFQFSKLTQGVLIQPPRWKACAEKTNGLFGMAVSYRYAQKYFPEGGIEKARSMVADLRQAFRSILTELTWLDPETKFLALKKAAKMKEFIGFPDWLCDPQLLEGYYMGLEVFYAPSSHFYSFLQAAHWHYRRNLRQLFEPKDREEWIMDPTVVNAFYSFTYNSINFPAGILQIPFFNLPIQALNYGAIGVIIGHEITHGFDDRGHQSDAEGNLQNWWRNSTRQNYLEKADCFVKQYSNYKLEVDQDVIHVNGRNTLGENIADNGGLRQAFEAYRLYVGRHGPEPSLPGLSQFTAEQLFYLSYAQLWCGDSRPTSLRQQLESGVHSPNRIRVQGALANSLEFSRTWNCTPPKRPCRIW